MKILHIISGNQINGAATYCKLLCERLVQSGHELFMMVRSECWLKDVVPDSISIVECELQRSIPELRMAADWIRANQIDVIHTHMTRAHSFGVLLKKLTGVPVIATAHNRSFQLHWRLNDYVIANSEATRRYHVRRNWILKKKIETVYCYSDLSPFTHITAEQTEQIRSELNLRGDEVVAGIVGSVDPRKGHSYLFDALPQIIEAIPNFMVVVIGPYCSGFQYADRLRAKLDQQGLADHVKWLGVRSDVPALMSVFDLLAVPSVEEPLGLVAIEAHAAGTPVVASNVGGLPEIVYDEVNGLLVPPRDTAQLAEAIIRLGTSPELRQTFGETGQEMVADTFDPVKLTKRVETIYREVVERKAVGRKWQRAA